MVLINPHIIYLAPERPLLVTLIPTYPKLRLPVDYMRIFPVPIVKSRLILQLTINVKENLIIVVVIHPHQVMPFGIVHISC